MILSAGCHNVLFSQLTSRLYFIFQGTPSPPGSPWPLPQQWIKSNTVFTLHPELFKINAKSEDLQSCDVLKEGIDRYRKLMFLDPQGKACDNYTHLYNIFVEVDDLSCDYPKLGDNENYTIEIPLNVFHHAKLKAASVWGALKGLETLSQLVYQDTNRSYLINATRISDWPRFKYRGLLLDTARHFQPLSSLLHNLVSRNHSLSNRTHHDDETMQ